MASMIPRFLLLLPLCFLSLLVGCQNVEIPLTYEFRGRMVDENSEPVVGLPVEVIVRHAGKETSSRTTTSISGQYVVDEHRGITAGYKRAMGLFPTGSGQVPTPPALRDVYLRYQIDGRTTTKQVTLAPSDQERAVPGYRAVVIPEIIIPGGAAGNPQRR